jgi:beta-glucanase (GH16 family)
MWRWVTSGLMRPSIIVVYGLDWGKDDIGYYVDGVLVRSVENTHWDQPLF